MATTDSVLTTPPPATDDALTGAAPSPKWRWFWGGLFLAVCPLLIPYFADLWENPTYGYFPFAIASVVWLAYLRSDHQFYPPRGWMGWAAITAGLLSLLIGLILQFPWFAAIALVLIAGALLQTMRGERDDSLLVLVLPLLTIVRLIRADQLLVQYLQTITTWLSSVLLDAFSVPHAVANNVIQLADRELFVAEACSGIQSVFTLGFLALLMVAWRRRRIWMTPLYLLIACLLAVFANVIRVTVVALATTWYEADLAEGWSHDLLGYIALAIAGGFLLSFDHLIATLLHRVPEESEFNPFVTAWNYFALRPQESEGVSRSTQQLIAERDQQSHAFQWAQKLVENRGVQIGFLAVAGVISLASIAQIMVSRKPVDIVYSDSALVFDPPPEMLESSLTKLSVVDYRSNRGYQEPRLGANSDIWECNFGDNVAQFVLSQPHKGWHELCDCYVRLDWKLLDRDIRSGEDFDRFAAGEISDDDDTSYIVARFKRPPGQYGYLLFAGIGSDGSYIEAPDSFSAFTHRVWNRINTSGVWQQNEVIMMQMWVTTTEKLTPRDLKEIERDFIAARATFAAAITENAGKLSGTEVREVSRSSQVDSEVE